MSEFIKREDALKPSAILDVVPVDAILSLPAARVVEVPETGIGDLSDGYHTFNGLYYQRMMLFAALVRVYRDRAWKSLRHEDGELCFGGGWFVVGIDTPEGSYTYHYEDKYYGLFDCEELPAAKHWDGHDEKDVTRLLSLPADVREVVLCKDCTHNRGPKEWHIFGAVDVTADCEAGMGYPPLGWFCARGERRGADMREAEEATGEEEP